MRRWGWGDYWGAFCLVIAIIALKAGLTGGGWIVLILAGVGGYVALNIWQRQIEDREAERGEDDGEAR